MTNQNDILIKINIDNTDSTKNIKEIDKSVNNLQSTVIDLNKSVEGGFSNMGDTINESSDDFKKLENNINNTADANEKLEKSSSLAGKGLKGIGTAFKAIGIGAIVGLFVALWEAMQKNQKVMDAINKVMEIIGIVFNVVTEAITSAFESVNQATGGFDAMKKVIIGLLDIAITPLKLSFYAIKGAIIGAQLIWEKSFLGSKDPNKIKALEDSLSEIKNDIVDTAKTAVEAGKSIANNIGEAIGEVGQLVTAVATNVTNAVKTMSIETIAAQADMLVSARKALAELEIQQQGLDLKYKQQQELQRQIRDDVSLTTEERIKANSELGRLLDEQLGEEQKLLNEKIKIAKLELSIDKDSHEKKLALMQLQVVDQAELNERITGMKSEQLVNEQGLIKEAQDKKLADEKDALDKSNAQIKANQDVLLAIYRRTEEEKLKMSRDTQLLELEATTLSEEEKANAKLEIEKNYREDLQELKDEALEKEEEERQKKIDQESTDREDRINATKEEAQAVLAVMQQTSALLTAISDLRFQNETNALNKSQEEQLKNFSGTEAEKAKLLKKFAKEKADLEYRQAKARKVQSLIDAGISTALAIATALPNIPLSILAGLLGVAQIAIIAGTQIPQPQYAKGGVLKGPSHANGGITTPFGEMEGGEGIINNVSMSNPDIRNIASAANEAGGGVGFGNGQGINLSTSTISAIVGGINSKKVILNTNELNKSNDRVALIDNESYL